MLPVELLAKVGEIVLSAVSEAAGDRLLSRRGDSRRQFGRDMIDYYDDLERYSGLCDDLATLIEDPAFLRSGRLGFSYLWDRAEQVAADLRTITGRLMDRFWPVLHDEYLEENARLTRRPRKRARRRGAVMDIYDQQLAEIVLKAYLEDELAEDILRDALKMHFDKHRREIWNFSSHVGEITALFPFMEPWCIVVDDSWVVPAIVNRFELDRDREQILQIADRLRHNSLVVQELREKVKTTIRQHFTIDDLL